MINSVCTFLISLIELVIAPEPNPLIKGWVRLKLCSGVRPDGHTVPFYWNPDSLEEDSHEVALGKR